MEVRLKECVDYRSPHSEPWLTSAMLLGIRYVGQSGSPQFPSRSCFGQAYSDEVEPANPDVLDSLRQRAEALRAENAQKFTALKAMSRKTAENGRLTPKGAVSDSAPNCLLCSRLRHTCAWELRQAQGKEKGQKKEPKADAAFFV